MTFGYLFTWLMIFLRGVGIVLLLPEMAGRQAPIMLRLGLAVFLATLLTGLVPAATMPPDYFHLVLAAGGEVLLGLGLGFIAQITFYAADFAARIISSEVGLSAAPGLPTVNLASQPIAGLITSFTVVLFFLFGGHLMVLSAFARSFVFAPPGHPAFNASVDTLLINLTSHLVEIGVRIAAPFLGMNFLITLAFAVLGRAVPKMGVFIISASLRSLAGLALLGSGGVLIAHYLFGEFSATSLQMLQLLPAR